MLILFFTLWGFDAFIVHYSTILADFLPVSFRVFPAVLSLGFGVYLIMKAHAVVFSGHSQLIDVGVYAWVRHPMYLGTLLFCLGFFWLIPSLLALIIWIAFFVLYDKMATYEENDLRRILGKDYAVYQQQVPKWLPRPVKP